MSYLVFARKWRPQSFDEVMSQAHVTVTLKNAIASGRIGHSFLMTGPRGVGKTTTARILAKALKCEKGPTPEPCQICESCKRITNGSHIDVMEIDGASNRGINEIRELREKAMYATVTGKYKIYIIDEVHMLTKEAFNALLKILEEPPDSVIFIFATTQPRKVPDTILSRCQRFDFRRIPVSDMTDYLLSEAGAEGIKLDQRAVSFVCRASGGSMRDALSLMDQLVSFAGNDIKGSEVVELLGLVETNIPAEMSYLMLAGKTAEAVDSVSTALARGYSVEELIDALAVFLRNLLLVASGAKKGLDDVSETEMEFLRKIGENVSDIAVLNIMRIITGASADIRNSNLPRVTFESAVITASKISMALELDDLPEVSFKIASKRHNAETVTARKATKQTKKGRKKETGKAESKSRRGKSDEETEDNLSEKGKEQKEQIEEDSAEADTTKTGTDDTEDNSADKAAEIRKEEQGKTVEILSLFDAG